MSKYPNNPGQVVNQMDGDIDPVLTEGAPMVGIFWLKGAEVVPPGAVGVSEPARTAQSVAGFRDSPYDHIRMWPSINKLIPGGRGKEYDEIPRGRVIYMDEVRKFRVFLPPALERDELVHQNILSAFNLPRNNTEFIGDEHYDDPENIDWNDFAPDELGQEMWGDDADDWPR